MRYLKLNLNKLFNVVYVGQDKFDEPWTHFSRQANEFIIYFVKDGDLFIEEAEKQYHITKGEYFIFEPNKAHFGYQAAPVHYYYLHLTNLEFETFEFENLEMMSSDVSSRRLMTLSSDSSVAPTSDEMICTVPKLYKFNNSFDLYKILDAMCYEMHQKNDNYKIFNMNYAFQALIKMNRQFNDDVMGILGEKSYSTVKKVITYLENTVEEKITIEDIESHSGLKYSYLNRIFKSATGFTIKHYQNKLRIQRAQHMIEDTPLSFAEISKKVGIDDQFYFSKLFKNKTGLTPSQYKNQFQASNEKNNK